MSGITTIQPPSPPASCTGGYCITCYLGNITVEVIFLCCLGNHIAGNFRLSRFGGDKIFMEETCMNCSLVLPPMPHPQFHKEILQIAIQNLEIHDESFSLESFRLNSDIDRLIFKRIVKL